MKKVLFFIMFLFCLSINVFSQGDFWSVTSLDSTGISIFSKTNDNILYAGGPGELYKSIDGGLNWINLFNNWSYTYINSVITYNDSLVLIGTGNYGQSNYVGILRSFDQGSTWSKIAFIDTGIGILYEHNGLTFATTFTGDIYCSADTGLGWEKVYENTTGNGINSFAGDNNSKLIAGFLHGSIARSSDNGISWTMITPNWTVLYVYDLLFVDDFILAATDIGIFKSTDFGENWDRLGSEIIFSAARLLFIPPAQIYAMDGNWMHDKFYFSNDKGENWDILNSGLPENSYFYDMTKHRNYIFVGSDYGVYKSEEITSVQDKQDNIISKFSLSQNYPNPFNPKTKIDYQIAQLGIVSIKVYDILGKEVAILVNKVQSTGNYYVNFEGTNLPSGIYFYQLKSGDFIQTRKMILLK